MSHKNEAKGSFRFIVSASSKQWSAVGCRWQTKKWYPTTSPQVKFASHWIIVISWSCRCVCVWVLLCAYKYASACVPNTPTRKTLNWWCGPCSMIRTDTRFFLDHMPAPISVPHVHIGTFALSAVACIVGMSDWIRYGATAIHVHAGNLKEQWIHRPSTIQ